MGSDRIALPSNVAGVLGLMSMAGLLGRLGSTILTLVSQGAVNLGFFLTNLVLVRSLPASEFGTFAIVMGLLPFAANLYAAFVTHPATLRLTEPGADISRVVGGTIVTGLSLSLPIAIGISIAALVVGEPEIAVWAPVAATTWLAQVAASRALVAQQRYAAAAFGDMVCYLGMPAGVAASLVAGQVSIAVPFISLTCTAGLALLFQAWRCGTRPGHFRPQGALLRHFWHTGRVAVLGALVEGAAMQFILWTLLATHGRQTVAVFVALRSLIGVSYPLIFSIGPLVIPAIARDRHKAGMRGAVLHGAAVAAPLVAGALVLYALIAGNAALVIALVYGDSKGYVEHSDLLCLLALSCVFVTAAECTSAVLRGLGHLHTEAKGQLLGSGIGALVSVPVTAAFGLVGCALFGGVASLCRFAAGLSALWRLRREAAGGPVPAARTPGRTP